MKGKSIPNDVKQKAKHIIVEFNRKTFPESDCFYEVRFRGKYLYLGRCDLGVKALLLTRRGSSLLLTHK